MDVRKLLYANQSRDCDTQLSGLFPSKSTIPYQRRSRSTRSTARPCASTMSQDAAAPDAQTNTSPAPRAIFVGNFEYDTRSTDLHRLFAEHGAVSRIDLKRGFAFVFMRDTTSGTAAIRALDGHSYGSRTLKVEWARGDGAIKRREDERRKRCTQPSDTLFVVNFDPSTTTDRILRTTFQHFGRIVRLDMQQRFAFVQFETIACAADALQQLNGSQLADRILTVEYTVRSAATQGRKRAREHDRRYTPLRNPRSFRRYARPERPRSPYSNTRPYHFEPRESHYHDLDREPDNADRVDAFSAPASRTLMRRSRTPSPKHHERRSRSRSPKRTETERSPKRTSSSPVANGSPRRNRSPRRSSSPPTARSPGQRRRSRSPARSRSPIDKHSRRYSRSPIRGRAPAHSRSPRAQRGRSASRSMSRSRSRSRDRHSDWSRDGREKRERSASPRRKRFRGDDNGDDEWSNGQQTSRHGAQRVDTHRRSTRASGSSYHGSQGSDRGSGHDVDRADSDHRSGFKSSSTRIAHEVTPRNSTSPPHRVPRSPFTVDNPPMVV